MVFLYSVFPSILKLINKTNKKKSIIMIVLIYTIQVLAAFFMNQISAIHNALPDFHNWFSYIFPLFRLGDFVIGCNVGYIFTLRDKQNDKEIHCLFLEVLSVSVVLVLIVIQTVFYPTEVIIKMGYNHTWWINTIYFELSSALLIYILAINKGFISRLLCKSAFVALGNISSITYLIHLDCIKYLESIFKIVGIEIHGKVLLLIIALPITIICSLIWLKIYNKFKSQVCF